MLPKILTALDFPTIDQAAAMADRLRGKTGFKVGLELNTGAGTPAVVDAIGEDVFLDLKFHDIPNTVAGAVKAACGHGVAMLNVHCLGGEQMMRAASKAANEWFVQHGWRPMIIGVTILTSHDQASLLKIGIDPSLTVEQIVGRLAALAANSGLDGVVCSPKEITIVRQTVCDDGFLVVTPGIRSASAPEDDQKRTMPARQAVDLGATNLVIGRPITGASDPLEVAESFLAEIL